MVAWAVSSLGLVLPALVVLSSQGSARPEIQTILVTTAISAAISLGIGALFGRPLAAAQRTVKQRVFALFWPHLVVLAALGGLAMFLLYAAALSRIH